MNKEHDGNHYSRDLYLWLSIVLYVPVLTLPMRLMFGHATPVFGVDIEAHWLLLGSCLLLAAIVADAVIDVAVQRGALLSLLLAGGWIFAVSLLIPWLISHPSHGWLLGMLFMVHGWQSGWVIVQDRDRWWHRIGCLRDNVAALTVFCWLHNWPAY